MQKIINIHVEKLPEWVYLATSEDMPGLVPQGRRVIESLKISGIFQGNRRLNKESQRRKKSMEILSGESACYTPLGFIS
jgi:hypothetical protein